MSATLQRQEQGYRPLEQTAAIEADSDRRKARAFLLTGLAWWLAGDAGREAGASTVGLSAAQLTPSVLAAKGLLFAAWYHWLRGR
jgi:hypothetical protein